jgi:hypothetical protein
MTDPNSATGYGAAFDLYHRLGWPTVLPLPRGKKKWPPKGYTGEDGIDPSYADMQTWADNGHSDGNLALRTPATIIGIDVDNYGDKNGAATIAHAETSWAKLPLGYRSSARPDDPHSGIRWFRIPPGVKLRDRIAFGDLGLGGVEIIQRHHRYGVVWPSTHPDTGELYCWYAESGNSMLDQPPAVDDLPHLPGEWIEALQVTETTSTGAETGPDGNVGVQSCLTEGEMSQRVAFKLGEALTELYGTGRHDHTRDRALGLLRCGKNDEPGVKRALNVLCKAFVDHAAKDRLGGKAEALGEFKSFVYGDKVPKLLADASYDDESAESEFDDDPIPLTGNTVDVPTFPVDALPDVIANKVVELAEATQTDPAMAATSALSVLAACAGGHAKIQVRRGWCEPLCLYTNTIARPAERKSAVQESMIAPLHDTENEMSVAGEMERLKLADDLDMAKKTVERLNKSAVDAAATAANAGATDKDKEAAVAAAEAARDAKALMREIQVPIVPRLLADDVTPEATASLLADHNGRIAIISAEGGIFDTIAGRYARTVNMDIFLKGHSGDRVRVDRQGRPPQHIPSPALTMGLMVQPRVIEAIAANRDFVGRGLLARFLYATPVSKVGSRVSTAAPVSPDTESRYHGRIKKLATNMAGWAGDPAILTLAPEAEAYVRQIQDDVEPTLAGDGELASPASLTEWGGKFVGAVVRIAGLLHLGEHGGADSRTLVAGPNRPVQVDTIKAAERIGEYFKAVAINVFAGMGHPDIADAVYLLDRVEYLGQDEVSERDLLVASSRPRFPTKADMMPALRRLIEHGYLIPLPTPKPTGGRPASPKYKVHFTSTEATKHTKGST